MDRICGVWGSYLIYPKPYSIDLRGTIGFGVEGFYPLSRYLLQGGL